MAQAKYLIDRHNVDILALMETRVHSKRAHNIIEKLNMHNVVEIVSKGFSGRIWLLWKNNASFEVQIIKTHKRFIHCQIKDNNKAIM